jgi:glycosyltransferase involved in cell wall biosynthesis
MRIGIDAHALGTGSGGNETYIRELLYALRAHAPSLDLVAYVQGRIAYDQAATAGVPTHVLNVSSSYLRVPIELPLVARRTHVDLLHVQYNAPPLSPCPFVVSLHDICWKRYPKFLPRRDRYRLRLLVPGTLKRAAGVFALTRAAGDEIAEAYRVPPERIDVVSPSVDPLFSPVTDSSVLLQTRARYSLPPEYIVYIGALQPRKNLVRLATAFARLADRGFPHRLLIVGKRAWLYGDMLTRIEELNLVDRLQFTDYVALEDLPKLLSAASAFAYVSLYEGFGIPVAEAMACGAPVVTSDTPALREVAGDAAVFCDPLDVDAIEDALVRVLSDSDLARKLSAAGPERAKRFSRQAMAQAASRGYEKALS